jgi:GT2 family glycosyltransferase
VIRALSHAPARLSDRLSLRSSLYSLDPSGEDTDAARWEIAAGDDGSPRPTLWIRRGRRAAFRASLRGHVTLEASPDGPLTVAIASAGRASRRAASGPDPGAFELGELTGAPVEIVLEPEPGDGGGDGWIRCENPSLVVRPSALHVASVAFGKTAALLLTRGPGAAARRVVETLARGDADAAYARWIARHERPAPATDASARLPLVTFLVAAGPDDPPEWLERCLASIRSQTVASWEIARDLAGARGEYVALLAGDGELAADAVEHVGRRLAADPGIGILYSDEDRRDPATGRRHAPFFKPAWSPEHFLSRMYTGQLVVCRRDLVEATGGLPPGRGPARLYDLMLRLVDAGARVEHLPRVLWHGYAPPGADGGGEAARAALRAHVRRTGLEGEVGPGVHPGSHRVSFAVRGAPLVSIVIPIRDRVTLLRRCLDAVRAWTEPSRYEVIVVDHASVEPETQRFLAACGHRVVPAAGDFNFARLNNLGVRHASGTHLLFLNNDTEPLHRGWLTALLEWSQQPEIGAVGAKLYYPDGRLQHVGIALGVGAGAAQLHRGSPGAHRGYFDSALVVRNCSAVTAACLMTRRAVFEEAGGFDERFAVDFNDVDYCLRVGRLGYRVLFTPHARLLHHEFSTRPRTVRPSEHELFRSLWRDLIPRDPFYSPHLSRRFTDARIAS